MIHKILSVVLLFVLAAGTAKAAECQIEAADLTQQMQALAPNGNVSSANTIDPDSGEPVRRYVMMLDDGSLLIIEQKHCLMYNLMATLISTAEQPSNEHLRLLATALASTPMAKHWFPGGLRDGLLEEFASTRFQDAASGSTYPIDDRVSAEGESSEALLSFARLEGDLPYSSIVSIYVGVGGL